jgi:hypothetical protein
MFRVNEDNCAREKAFLKLQMQKVERLKIIAKRAMENLSNAQMILKELIERDNSE